VGIYARRINVQEYFYRQPKKGGQGPSSMGRRCIRGVLGEISI